MEESLVPGETLPGNHFISHMGQATSRGTPKALYPPETLSSHMAEGLQWTAAGHCTGPMLSCQQADFGRSQGQKR